MVFAESTSSNLSIIFCSNKAGGGDFFAARATTEVLLRLRVCIPPTHIFIQVKYAECNVHFLTSTFGRSVY